MEAQAERPPPYVHHHEPDALHLPSVPSQDSWSVAAASAAPSATTTTTTTTATTATTVGVHLPDLKSLGLPASTPLCSASSRMPITSTCDTQQWTPMEERYVASLSRRPLSLPPAIGMGDAGSPMDVDESLNGSIPQRCTRNEKEILAAEAIVGLGNPDYMIQQRPSLGPSDAEEREPLLSLVTSRHPWIGNTIHGSLSAYSTTKTYSPRFVQSGADFLERNFANTVGTVGRRTGVEDSLRRYFGNGVSDVESGSHKRRRTENDIPDIEQGLQTPPMRAARTSGDSDISCAREDILPPYDAERSPEYERTACVHMNGHLTRLALRHGNWTPRDNSSQSPHWSTRVMITTSGLGVALSQRSLRSLKFCLNILRDAVAHIGIAMRALKLVTEDYEKATSARSPDEYSDESSMHAMPTTRSAAEQQREEESRRLANKIKEISQEIWETIKKVCSSVSQYTGGALPENAGNFVRRQLMSIPQRWQAANAASSRNLREGDNGASDLDRFANRMLAFAKEGLDMIAQVGMVVESTIESAERWLESLGRSSACSGRGAPSDEKPLPSVPPVMDSPPEKH